MLKLCGYRYRQGTYTPLWGVSTLLHKSCNSVQYPLEGYKKNR